MRFIPFLCIDNEGYEVDMINDNNKKVSENILTQHPMPSHIFSYIYHSFQQWKLT